MIGAAVIGGNTAAEINAYSGAILILLGMACLLTMHTDSANFLDVTMADVIILFVAGMAAARRRLLRPGRRAGHALHYRSRVTSCGFGFSSDSPYQARLTRWAATSSRFGLRASSHHWPVSATMPTSACE